MPIAVSEEHEELRRAVHRWVELHCPPAAARAALAAPPAELPAVWKEVAEQGWLGLHVDAADGGQGFGLVELVVVLEELGWAVAPGPVLPTVLAAAVLSAYAARSPRSALLRGLVDGSRPAAVHLGPGVLTGRAADDGDLVVDGVLRPVLGAPTAALLLAPLDDRRWCVVDVGEGVPGVAVEAQDPLDGTRALGEVRLEAVRVPHERVLAGVPDGAVADLALVLGAAECAGGARWCLETASEYAKVRVQFGRPIGQFQAVKHKLADMLVVVEQAAAAAWDAARAWERSPAGGAPAGTADQPTADQPTADQPTADQPTADERRLAASVAGVIALDGFATCAKECVQVLGGIGFTWEHDAHLYLKRAMATRQLLGDPGALARRTSDLAVAGARRSLRTDLPPAAVDLRRELAPLVAEVVAAEADERRAALVATGLLAPHWPAPFGRGADPLEQLVIDEALEAAGISRPNLGVGAWALPTLIAHGTAAQQERWVLPTMLGRTAWCQLFSEPGAGSDLAGLSTRAERVDGGWRLTGQKVWTSLARTADFGICLARSDPGVPKHEGITYFVVDMASEGIDVRPLRELTGAEMFNEVFMDSVLVPDDCVVGSPGAGWGIGRTTLANERVSMSSGATFGVGIESVLRKLARLGDGAPAGAAGRVGGLLAEAQALRLLGQRVTMRSLSGLDPGGAASVRKLLGVEHEQRIQECGLSLYGPDGAALSGSAERWGHGFLFTRCLTIAGGTSEVQRNVIAERLLGQPRDPEPA